VDNAFIECPHRWNVHFIRNFMLVFGPLSSIFDFATFGLLLWLLHSGPASFHTGWFVESVLSATIVVFAVRTRLPFQHSRPARAMLAVTAFVALAALALPYTPLAGIMGFQPLPVQYLLGIAGIVIAYFFSAEFTKRWFFRRFAV
jgi:Mg2+-importing ATPase